MLAALIVTIGVSSISTSDRDVIQASIESLKRSIYLAQDEAVLRNTVTRLIFDKTKENVEFRIEYTENPEIKIVKLGDSSQSLSLREEEELQKKQKNFQAEFTPIEEFKKQVGEIEGAVELYDIYTERNLKLSDNNYPSLYFFPMGDREDALIFLLGTKEIAKLEVSSFLDKIEEEFFSFEDYNINDDESLKRFIKEQIENWKKE